MMFVHVCTVLRHASLPTRTRSLIWINFSPLVSILVCVPYLTNNTCSCMYLTALYLLPTRKLSLTCINSLPLALFPVFISCLINSIYSYMHRITIRLTSDSNMYPTTQKLTHNAHVIRYYLHYITRLHKIRPNITSTRSYHFSSSRYLLLYLVERLSNRYTTNTPTQWHRYIHHNHRLLDSHIRIWYYA